MKTFCSAVMAGITAASLGLGSMAWAQPDNGNRRGPPGLEQPRGHGQDKHGPKHKQKHKNGHAYGHGSVSGPAQVHVRGAGPDHNFYRGGRLPPQYRSRVYVVEDWRGHRLSAPPRGHEWVQTGGDYVMIAIATGVIAQILLGQ